ncbi:unnamed protein product [Alopecurus aequalis]
MKAGRHEISKKRVGGAAAAWLLVPLLVLVVLKTGYLPQVTRSYPSSAKLKAADGLPKTTDSVAEAPPSPTSTDEIAGDGVDAIKDLKHGSDILAMNGEIDGSLRNSDVASPISKLSCNFSYARMNICNMEGDVRMHGKSAAVYVVGASDDTYRPEKGPVTIRPCPRKWEMHTMRMIREVTIRSSARGTAPPQCTVTHDVPAVVFSTGAFSSNLFHAMNDIVLPLYITAREYDGHVQLVATDYDLEFISKYRHIFDALSVYPVIDFDADYEVHCFPSAQVGIESHQDLGINPALSRNGYTIMDFQSFLRSAYSLKRAWATPASRSSGQRPRLVMILRHHSRALTNEAEAVAVATEVGFEVVAAGLEVVRDLAQFAEVVNSCDVVMGVHGAGLTNLVFLPHNGTLMQIIPWGDLKWSCWNAFGRPLPEMGLRYVEYEVTAEETTLKDVYPRDHAVFTHPRSLHTEDFDNVWKIFLDGQNVTLDIHHFRGVMQKVYQSITIT